MLGNRSRASLVIVTLAICLSLVIGDWSSVKGADPAAVQRFERAWKYPQAGWLVVHIEGSPYERGFQHGHLLAREIADFIKALARARSHKDPEAAWKQLRLLTDTAFLRKYDVELLEDFLGAFASSSASTLHVEVRAGRNAHHIIEAAFKALARALRQAVERDERIRGIPSTKGVL